MTLRLMAALQQTLEPVEEISSINSQALGYVKVLFVLFAILILAYLTVRFWMPKLSGLRGAAVGPIQVAGRLAIEPRKTLYLIRTGQEMFLIATSDSDVHYLTAVSSVPADQPVATSIKDI